MQLTWFQKSFLSRQRVMLLFTLFFTYLEVFIFIDHLCVLHSRGRRAFLQAVGWKEVQTNWHCRFQWENTIKSLALTYFAVSLEKVRLVRL